MLHAIAVVMWMVIICGSIYAVVLSAWYWYKDFH